MAEVQDESSEENTPLDERSSSSTSFHLYLTAKVTLAIPIPIHSVA
jgi:hypothetical protein